MAHGTHIGHLEVPPKITLPKWWMPVSIALMVVGAAAFFVALFAMGDAILAWKAYLIGFIFFTLLGISGPFFTSCLYLTRAGWSATIRRIPEAFGMFVAPAGVFGVILMAFGAGTLYEWTHPHEGDEILAHKLPYLNQPRAIISAVIVFAVIGGLAWFMNRNSRLQDKDGKRSHTLLNARLSSLFLILMSLGLSVIAIDFLMSQQPHWFSTMWAPHVWANMFQAGMALSVIIVMLLIRSGAYRQFIRPDHLHDLGKLLFATTAFWAYIAFCEFLLIWYANMPEETMFYVQRIENGWLTWSIVLPIVKFVIPFLLLLPRNVKRGKGLMPIAIWILIMCVYEVWWWVAPAPAVGAHHTHPHFPIIELLVFGGFAGMFMLIVGHQLAAHHIVPIKDPRLHEALHFHQ